MWLLLDENENLHPYRIFKDKVGSPGIGMERLYTYILLVKHKSYLYGIVLATGIVMLYFI